MKRSVKRILPIILGILVICSMIWYFCIYDRGFTRDILLTHARYFDDRGNHNVAAWFYSQAYRQSNNDETVAIELAEKFKEVGNFTKAEATLSNAIADGGSAQLYIALCRTYVQQDKLLDAVNMLDTVADPLIKEELEALRPQIPSTSPAPGFYNQYISVCVECPDGMLYVSTDGDYPSVADPAYSDAISLVAGENTIYALAIGDNGLVSSLAVYGYVVGGVVENVTLSDSAMDTALRELLGKEPEDTILTSELWTVTSLTVPSDVSELSDLQYLPYLEQLTVENGKFSGLSALSYLSNLTELTVRGSVLSSSDLETIASLPALQRLTLENCGLSSVSALRTAKTLTALDLNGNAIRDITPLAGLTALESLDLSQNAISQLTALSDLSALKTLDVSYNSLVSLEPLSSCLSLTALDASHNTIGLITGLDNLKALTTLSLANNSLTDVSLLSGNTALTNLDISNNTILDISGLSSLTVLTDLDFSNNEVTALPAFSANCPLVNINGSYNKLTKLDALAGISTLNHVIMEYNSIKSVDCLAGCHHLISVNVYGNPVKDVSKLTEQSIIVYYTPV